MARKSSKVVRLSVVPLLAASFLAGCGDDEETAYCVDENDEVVENRFCEDEYDNGGVGVVPFFWYFGGGGTVYSRGQRVAGGEKVRASDRAALARRGGFGSQRSSSSGVGRSYSSGSSGGG